jgi:hypothetical protein
VAPGLEGVAAEVQRTKAQDSRNGEVPVVRSPVVGEASAGRRDLGSAGYRHGESVVVAFDERLP